MKGIQLWTEVTKVHFCALNEYGFALFCLFVFLLVFFPRENSDPYYLSLNCENIHTVCCCFFIRDAQMMLNGSIIFSH